MSDKLRRIPTNIITGFLGVGKTTTISYLLATKPANERWAVLVNEFGEIGIDGSLLQGKHSAKEQVFIAEVPGGCMCCVMGLPTKVTLNKLLKQAKPDRLIIEPTGLGHPQEVLDLLRSEHYCDVLDVRSTITLVDARVLADRRYTEHDIFNQQLQVADVVVASKSDCYQQELTQLEQYVQTIAGKQHCPVVAIEQGKLPLHWLDSTVFARDSKHQHHHHEHDEESALEKSAEVLNQQLAERGYAEVRNHKGDYFSCGWRFNDDLLFDSVQIEQTLRELQCQRMKAVFVTDAGPFGFSLINGELAKQALQSAQGNSIELIDQNALAFDSVLEQLLQIRSSTDGGAA
ncbi:GTP-binding protein [Neiella sp. HB171785]|uniref:GTP-binding protein n=1 Tax=Neiella litorisoli TaxID=2771431 RepID=A0A8J6QIL4_9GAMM|nr:GTP-binding protein [Neiella litorisoli]MBD1390770.1 GTP-binding protein [Neiella litorisoli]